MLNFGPVWGIDIGDVALKAVKLKPVGKQIVLQDFQVVSYADIAGDPGARREGQVADALRALQATGLGHRERCLVSIPPQTVFNRFISLPPVDKRRVPEIVLYEARQQIPFSLDEVIWAYEMVRKEFIPGEEIEIGLFAVKREVIDGYLAELLPIWKQLYGIQIAPLGIYNFMRYEVDLEQPTVIMDIGAQSTDLLIVDGDKFWLRNLPIAGNSFTSILEKRLNIPRAEAEKLKRGVAESRHRRRLLEVLRPVMRDLVSEIQRSIGYYKSLSREVKFESVIVVGDGYRLFGLDRFLADQLQYKIDSVKQLQNIPYQGAENRREEFQSVLPSLGVALGLALQGLKRAPATINLLPDDFVVGRELHAKRFTGFIAAALVWAIVGCLYFNSSRALSDIDRVAGKGRGVLSELKDLDNGLKRAQDVRLIEQFKDFNHLGINREYAIRVVKAISAVMPRKVRIDKIELLGEGADRRSGTDGGRTEPGAAARDGRTGRKRGVDKSKVSEDEKAVDAAKLRIAFRGTCDATLEPQHLERDLPAELKKAAVYAEKVKIVTGVVIGRIQRETSGYGLDELGRPRTMLSAPVWVGLRTAAQARQLQEEIIEKRARDAEKAEAAERARRKAAKEAGKKMEKGPAAARDDNKKEGPG